MFPRKENYYAYSLVLVFITLMWSGGLFTLEKVRLSQVEQTIKSLKTVAESTKQSLFLLLEAKKTEFSRIIHISEIITAFRKGESSIDDIDKLLNKILLDGSVEGYYLLDSNGNNISSYGTVPKLSSRVYDHLKQHGYMKEVHVYPAIRSIREQVQGVDVIGGLIPAFYISIPIMDGSVVLGYSVFVINPMEVFSHQTQVARIGDSGETFSLTQQGFLLTESRFDKQLHDIGLINHQAGSSATLKVADPGINLIQYSNEKTLLSRPDWPLTTMAQSIQEKQTGFVTEAYNDYRGVPVLGYWIWVEELEIGIASEVDEVEAMTPYQHTKVLIISGLVVLTLSVLLLAVIIMALRQQMFYKLEKMTHIDGLTAISNRRYFDAFLENEYRRALRISSNVAVAMIDVDFFKKYNDHYGHLEGDECLKAVAKVINSIARRPSDLAARYGGEEFCLILSGTSIEEAFKLAEECRKKVASLKMSHPLSEIGAYVTISIGITSIKASDTIDPIELVRLADKALYQAKNNGRNRVEAITD